ncbi:MAG: hypothetical protein ACC707_16885 [Thiohalomonadales bacterium]
MQNSSLGDNIFLLGRNTVIMQAIKFSSLSALIGGTIYACIFWGEINGKFG